MTQKPPTGREQREALYGYYWYRPRCYYCQCALSEDEAVMAICIHCRHIRR
jgi:hypothetical protein